MAESLAKLLEAVSELTAHVETIREILYEKGITDQKSFAKIYGVKKRRLRVSAQDLALEEFPKDPPEAD